jgi:glutaconate CoA-transferase subunit A
LLSPGFLGGVIVESKIVSMGEAVRANVRDGDVIYLAGFTHLIPFAAGHEILRQGKRNLTLCRATPDLIYDQMVAAGCASKVVFSWMGNPGVGPLRAIRREIEAGRLEIEEYSHFDMVTRLMAGASDLPFLPVKSNKGSDLVEANRRIKWVTCPYTGESISTVPSLKPDVTFIHAQRADPEGNTQIWGIVGEQREAAFAAKRVVVSVEEIVPGEVVRSDPNRTMIPGFLVSAVVEEPWGAHPSYAQGFYDRDNQHYLAWDTVSRDASALEAWLEEWVLGVSCRREYMGKMDASQVLGLLPRTRPSYSVDYGIYR